MAITKPIKDRIQALKAEYDVFRDFPCRHAPFKLWQEYYKAFTLNIIQEVKKSHHPETSLQQVLA